MFQKTIQLSELKHSPTNVRQVKSSKESIAQLAASIQSKGLLHNLVVVKNGSGYNVVDGNRRLDALNQLFKDDKSKLINCVVLENNDDEVGLHANMMREDMHPLDECDVIHALVADGSEDFDSVAKRFGQTKRWVEQRVSLSELSDKAKEMFRAYKFNLAVAQALTLGNHEKQDEYLSQDIDSYHAESTKRAMTNAKIPVSAALFVIDENNTKLLDIEEDLFGGDAYITNRGAFEHLQESHIFNICQEYRRRYMDVIYLKDQYHWDSPECKTLDAVYGDDHGYADQDIIMVVTYNSIRYTLDEKLMVMRDIKEAQEAQDQAVEEEEEIVTPVVMSNPQFELVHAYFADYLLTACWKTGDRSYLDKLAKSLLCHRKLGYTYSGLNRVGHIYADEQSLFPRDEEPDGYTTPPYITLIEKHKDMANAAFERDGTSPLDYCMSLDTQELDALFLACCFTGISRYDIRHEELKKHLGDPDQFERWFKPDEKWLNKYKANQLSMLEDYLFGKVSTDSRANRIKAIREHLQKDPDFDPYGYWPQFKPQ